MKNWRKFEINGRSLPPLYFVPLEPEKSGMSGIFLSGSCPKQSSTNIVIKNILQFNCSKRKI
jgi:hypothetical protein